MLKDSTVALLPDVPQGVNNDAIVHPPTIFWEEGLCFPPPLLYAREARRVDLLW